MLKCFYKKKNKGKTFFNKNLKIRSVAYGDKINENYLMWLDFYKRKWDNVASGFWIFNRGDITGNCFRGSSVISKFSDSNSYTEKQVEYFSAPLFLFDHCYTCGGEGFLYVDDTRSIYIGDVKAWAIMTFTDGLPPYIVALIDVGAKGKLKLSLFKITIDGVKESTAPDVLIDSNHGKDYFLACFGNHIFLLHDSTLCYYYYNACENVLEEVCIGEDDEYRKEYVFGVCTEIVADYSGNVYWGAGNSIFCFKIGMPHLVYKIDTVNEFSIFRILIFEKKLFVTYGNMANGIYRTTSYEQEVNGFIKKDFSSDGERLIFIDKTDERYKYVKVNDKEVQLIGHNGTVLDRVTYDKGISGRSFFLINALLVRNLLSFGCNVEGKYYLIKEKC